MGITVPERFVNLVRRMLGLTPGRYFIVLSVTQNDIDFTVKRVGSIEK